MLQINEIGAMIKSMLHIKQYLKQAFLIFLLDATWGVGIKNPINYVYRGVFVLSIEVLNFVC